MSARNDRIVPRIKHGPRLPGVPRRGAWLARTVRDPIWWRSRPGDEGVFRQIEMYLDRRRP